MSDRITQDRIAEIEAYVKPLMAQAGIAHDYKHADRVRGWALRIAAGEGYPQPEWVAAAALLHDIGLASGDRQHHAETGAAMAADFLHEHQLFDADAIEAITTAIRYHASLDDHGLLLDILRDADVLDILGAVGLLRGLTSLGHRPDFPDDQPLGETWGFSSAQFTARFQQGIGTGAYVVDQLNFQISCYDNLKTATARELARPMVAYMREFMQALAAQVEATRFPAG